MSYLSHLLYKTINILHFFASYWDSSYDDDLLDKKVTRNLLYVQINSDIDRQWVLATKDQLTHLANLRKKGSKREVRAI